MSQLKVNSIVDASGGSNAVLYGPASPAGSMGFRNRIINGNMVIDQRNVGASVSTSSGSSAFVVDRWAIYYDATSKVTAQQNAGSVTPPAGFSKYLGATSSSAYTIGASERIAFQQTIEGFNAADFAWGTADAKAVTLSFWVRSSLTGTFGGSLRNGTAGNPSYPFTYSISAANTWEYKTITIAGPTTGTWNTTNDAAIQVWISLGAGSTVSGTAGSWAASTYFSATGATSVVGTNGATFYITGVQLEVGSVATEFERRPFTTELQLCQRYYEKSYNVNQTPGVAALVNGFSGFTSPDTASTDIPPNLTFKVSKRTAPTITAYNAVSGASGAVYRTSDAASISISSFSYIGENQVGTINLASGSVNKYLYHWTASAEL